MQSRVYLPSDLVLDGRVRDVSLNGVWFETEHALPVGNTVRVCLVLPGGNEELRIEAEGQVTRIEQGGVAIEFAEIDAESIEHLRKLVLYNAGDTDRVVDEFEAHIGLKRR